MNSTTTKDSLLKSLEYDLCFFFVSCTVYFILVNKNKCGFSSSLWLFDPNKKKGSVKFTGWKLQDDEEVLKVSGLDALTFCRFLKLGFQFFLLTSVVSLLSVLPLKYYFGESTRVETEQYRAKDEKNQKHGPLVSCGFDLCLHVCCAQDAFV